MTKFLKENWFVGVIAVFFICVAVFFAYDQNKDNLPSKSENGKDVVLSVDGTNITADEYYDELYKSYGQSQLFMAYYEAVIDESVKADSQLEATISNTISSTISYYYSNYGYTEAYLDQIAQYYYGFNTFGEYIRYSMLANKVYASYIEEHYAELITDDFISKHNPRMISYCLIKMDDPANPTEDDLNRLQAAKDAWNSDKYSADNFAEFAKAYSEDSSTASTGGVLGYVDDNSSLVDAFLTASNELEVGEVSEWVYDENYGYFLIKCDSKSYEDFKTEDDFISTVMNDNSGLAGKIVWEASEKLNVSFPTDEFKTYCMTQLGVAETAEESDGE